MTVEIRIFADTANEALADLKALSRTLTGSIEGHSEVSSIPEAKSAKAPEIETDVVIEADNVDNVDDAELDTDGHAWDADLHASTMKKTKDGLWRMKPGVARPAPKTGFPVTDQESEAADTVQEQVGSTQTPEQESVAASPESEDDEFAAFRNAAAKADAENEVAEASVPERKWTDADLGSLCNQAAMKMGAPDAIKELISQYVPEGEVSHSRNIPQDQRATFAIAVEEKAGIEYTG